MTLYPRDFGPGGIIRLFCFPIPCLFTSLGYIRPVFTPYTLPVHFPWVYSTYFTFLRPASSIFPGLNRLPSSIYTHAHKKPASDDSIVMRQAAFCT